MKNKINLSNLFMLIAFPLVILVDLLSKYLIEDSFSLGQTAKFLPGFINLNIVHNDGAAWSLFSGMQILLIIITILFLLILLWYFFTKRSKSILLGISVGLIVGGSLGNLYDRIFFGYVRDFLEFSFMQFPVFNIADIAITFGIILFAIYLIFIYPKEYKKTKQAEGEQK